MILRSQRLLVGEEQLARELLRQRAGAGRLAALDDVLDQRDDDARDAEAEVLLELGVLGGEDRLSRSFGEIAS